MNSACSSTLAAIEEEYLSHLQFWREKLTEETGAMIADEYEVFWAERKRRIETALLFLDSKPYSSYFMTSSLYPDFSSREHYPFLALGSYHILDTNLGPKIKTFSRVSAADKGYFFAAIKEGLDHEIDILSNHGGLIWLLPLTELFGLEETTLREKSNEFFLSFFPGIEDTKEFFSKMKTMADVYRAVDPQKAPFISFAATGDPAESLEAKWTNYKSTIEGGLPPRLSEPVFFYSILAQAARAALNAVLVAYIPIK